MLNDDDYPFRERPAVTEEEATVEHTRVDQILEANTRNLVCISCKQPIRLDQPLLETKHGPYHDRPFKCVDGRD